MTLFVHIVRPNRNADNWWHGNVLFGKVVGKFKQIMQMVNIISYCMFYSLVYRNEMSSLTYAEAMQLALKEREASPRIVWLGK